MMTAPETDNLALVRRYLAAVAKGATGDTLAAFSAPEIWCRACRRICRSTCASSTS